MGFVSVLKRIGEVGAVAAPIAASLAPGGSTAATLIPKLIGTISTMAVTSAAAAETLRGPGAGAAKMDLASTLVQSLIPFVVKSIEDSLGRDAIDEVLLAQAIGKYLDGTVDLMNALKVPADTPAEKE